VEVDQNYGGKKPEAPKEWLLLFPVRDEQTEFYSHKKSDLVITVFSPGIREYMPVYHIPYEAPGRVDG
jgi:hypothetical protein